jgi:hypothetical protein
MRTDNLRTAFAQHGFTHLRNGLGARKSGSGLLWTIKLDQSSVAGEQYCFADCGLLDEAAQRIAFDVWRALDARASQFDLQSLVIVSAHAGIWFQGTEYDHPERVTWANLPGESVASMCERAVGECWRRGRRVWERYQTRQDLFDLMTKADHPFPQWRYTNGMASATLYLALADLLDRPLDSCRPTLTRLWTIIRNTSGLHLTQDQLLETYVRITRKE